MKESRKYLDAATKMVFSGIMDSDIQSELIANLHELNLGSRCANSLIHEFGHVLQYRMWRNEGIDVLNPSADRDSVNADIFDWFDDLGYVELTSICIPQFDHASDEDVLLYLKEGFVEDYRTAMNMQSRNERYELPNAYCWRGDFELPDLMKEGVDIVKKALEKYNSEKLAGNGQLGLSSEPNRVALVQEMFEKGQDFQAGRSPMSADQRRAVQNVCAPKIANYMQPFKIIFLRQCIYKCTGHLI